MLTCFSGKDSESETDEPPVKLLKGNGKKVGKRVAAMKKMFEPTEDKPKRMRYPGSHFLIEIIADVRILQ